MAIPPVVVDVTGDSRGFDRASRRAIRSLDRLERSATDMASSASEAATAFDSLPVERIDQASNATERMARSLSRLDASQAGLRALRRSFIAAGAAATGAGLALTRAFGSAFEFTNEVTRNAAAVGVSAAEFQILANQARLFRIDMDDVGDVLQSSALALGEMRAGAGGAGDALRTLGVNAADTYLALIQIAQGLSRVQEQGERTRLGSQIFGEDAFRRASVLLERIAELGPAAFNAAGSAGGIVGDAQLRSLESLRRSLSELSGQLRTVLFVQLARLSPLIEDFLSQVPGILLNIRDTLSPVAEAFREIAIRAERVWRILGLISVVSGFVFGLGRLQPLIRGLGALFRGIRSIGSASRVAWSRTGALGTALARLGSAARGALGGLRRLVSGGLLGGLFGALGFSRLRAAIESVLEPIAGIEIPTFDPLATEARGVRISLEGVLRSFDAIRETGVEIPAQVQEAWRGLVETMVRLQNVNVEGIPGFSEEDRARLESFLNAASADIESFYELIATIPNPFVEIVPDVNALGDAVSDVRDPFASLAREVETMENRLVDAVGQLESISTFVRLIAQRRGLEIVSANNERRLSRVRTVVEAIVDAQLGIFRLRDDVGFTEPIEAIGTVGQDASDELTALQNVAVAVGSSIGDAFAEAALQARSFGDVLRGLFETIVRSASRAFIGAPLAEFFSNLAGRQFGGPVQAGTPYVVGERGPELFVPFTSGQVLSNNDSFVGGDTFNINVNGTNAEEVRAIFNNEIVPIIKEARSRSFQRSIERGRRG